MSGSAFAAVLEVDDSGGRDHITIQAAVSAANDSDTIVVYPGVYTENVDINKELTIFSFSKNPDDTIVQASDANVHIFNVTANNVTIRGFSITSANGSNSSAIILDTVLNNTIDSNKLVDNSIGIFLNQSINNTIYNNLFNNTNNIQMDGKSDSNIWNTTKSSGSNVIEGSSLGGNYWATPNGTGFSQTCNDADKDGFCDLPYSVTANNSDYLPLNLDPSIDIELSIGDDDADMPLGPYVRYFYKFDWTYNVTNTGNINLTNITVNDDSAGFVGVFSLLSPGSSVEFTTTEQAKFGHNENHAITKGTSPQDIYVEDSDPGHYFGYSPIENYEIPTAHPFLTASVLGIVIIFFLRRELKQ